MRLVYNSLADVPEAFRAEFVEQDGKAVLKIEGDLPKNLVSAADLALEKSKVSQFRENNIALKTENETLKTSVARYDGIDPVEAKTAIEKVKTLGNKGITNTDDLEARIRAAAAEAVGPVQSQLAEERKARLDAEQRSNDMLLRATVGDTFQKAGGKAKATDFVVGQAKEFFEVKEGRVVAKAGKLDAEGNPLSIEGFLTGTIKREHDYVFEPSNGAGVPPNKQNGGAPALKDGQRILKNPTMQELGQYADEIASGKVKVFHEEAKPVAV